MAKIKKLSSGRLLVLGFAAVILLGAILLALPFTAKDGSPIRFIDALFTATSAVCVTGLVVVDTFDTFNGIGQAVIALLIQVGGLGIASVGVTFILLARRRVSYKERILVKDALSLDSVRGIVKLVQSILLMTLSFEAIGIIVNFIVFSKDYPLPRAIGLSVFHAISSFNNAGFDLFGGFVGMTIYKDNVLLNLTTCGLIIFGGLGFFVIKDVLYKRSFKKLSLHSKVVLLMTGALLVSGTLLFKLTENLPWLGAFFFSTTARTAGFNTFPLSSFTNAGLFILVILMFIGASPGSTGGGVKTTTIFALVKQVHSSVTNRHCVAFKRKIPMEIAMKSFLLVVLALALVCINTLILCILEPQYTFIQLLFETVSAFGTVGLSTGITPSLSAASKGIIILTMFVGRLGPLTMATIWSFKPLSSVTYSEESITIG